MTTVDTTQPDLWDTATAARPRVQRLRPAPPPCALCKAPAASPFGLCARCLAAAVAEAARLLPRPADPDDPRPAAISFSSLCRRCGSHRHATSACAA